ncbi:MAG: hypothetical protein H6737_21125 [Alphaproteobacteria bacterium]|nr:hypothetical protein [Alphaproteobacteria bacterium]
MTWYAFSGFLVATMTSSSTALFAMPGFEVWGEWVGRFAVLPALGMLGGLAFLLRHQWRARRVVDAVVAPRVLRTEPLAVMLGTLIVATFTWIARPKLDPVTFCMAVLLACVPLLWLGIRTPSRTTRWVWPLIVLCVGAGGVLGWLEAAYGPLEDASDAELRTIVAGVMGLTAAALVLGIALVAVAIAGFVRAERAWNRGDLEGLATMSFGGMVDDHPLVLEALRRCGRADEALERYRRLVSSLPAVGPVHVVIEILADREDPRAEGLARAAVEAYPLSPSTLLAFGRVFRVSDPEAALDAVEAGRTRAFGGESRRPVFDALEACILAHLGQRAVALRKLEALDLGEHPVHREDAARYAAEARTTLESPCPIRV